ncbi:MULTISPECIES: hypothetical protein [unclassified Cyanobium]|uniref:P-type ATPase n=1 Tax=unclassified Cyanobium TaxID=2627006 RepID=UPI0020CD1293|nr:MULTISPECIES: hypothetical protein [unclassified Cyanobium]
MAEAIEARAVQRARQAITSLMAMAPEEAEVRWAEGRWHKLPVRALQVGDRVRVRPGERLPLDGTVLRGESAINQAPITGESLPVDKACGDPVYAGTSLLVIANGLRRLRRPISSLTRRGGQTPAPASLDAGGRHG